MKNILLLLPLFILMSTGCSTALTGHVVKTEDGLTRFEDESNGGDKTAIRREDKTLILDENEAAQTIKKIKTVQKFAENDADTYCQQSNLYNSKKLELDAIEDLKAGLDQKALEKLAEAEKICPNLYFVTGREYYRAVALNHTGDKIGAEKAAKKFLDFSAEISPASYEQYQKESLFGVSQARIKDNMIQLRTYRERAQNFLVSKGDIDLAPEFHPRQVAKFPNHSFFAPGGNTQPGAFIIPGFGYSSLTGVSYGAAVFRSWGINGMGASYFHSAEAKDYGAISFRRSLYESENRNLNWDAYISGRTIKKLKYTTVSLGAYEDIEVVDERFAPGIGTGATYRFTPSLALSGEGSVFDNRIDKKVDTFGSLYGTYYFLPEVGLFGGYLQNRVTAGFELLFVQVAYDFKNEALFTYIQGLKF